eukprot:g32058.t1
MGYKVKLSKIADKDTSLPDMLNAFYVPFKQNASGTVTSAPTAPDTPVPSVTTTDVRSVFLGVNPRKAMGPDGGRGQALRSCVDQLAEVFTEIFNLSLLQAKVPICFKKTTIIPIPKKAHAVCLNDHLPMTLTSIIAKFFERLVMAHINSSLPACLNSLQFAYRSTADTISLALHSPLEHLNNKDTYVRLLLIDYSSAFNTIITSKSPIPRSRLCPLQQDPQLSDPQTAISKDSKTKELTIDFRKEGGEHPPIYINGTEVEKVNSVKFLGVAITNDCPGLP